MDIGDKVNVLDAGFIQLLGVMGSDKDIADRARNSYQSAKTRTEDGALIDHLVRNRHTSPLEFGVIQVQVKCPLYIARQWQRHRASTYATFNEASYRYSEAEDEFWTPEVHELRGDGSWDKQVGDGNVDKDSQEAVRIAMKAAYNDSYSAYKYARAKGVCREQARAILPTGMYTMFAMKMDLHNILHFINLRNDAHAQKEIAVYAEVLENIVEKWFPLTHASWFNHVKHAITFSKDEWEILKEYLNMSSLLAQVDSTELSKSRKREFYVKLNKE